MKKGKKKLFTILMACAVVLFGSKNVFAEELSDRTNEKFVYLSDLSYVEELSFAAENHVIHLDENEDNKMLTLKINDTATPFIKGLCAWADSEIVYDLSKYDYDYFTTYLGVDISEQNDYYNTGVQFFLYTSADGENWDEAYRSAILRGWDEAEFVRIDIKEAAYLKLCADDASEAWWSAWYDEAVYADARLIKADFEEEKTEVDFIKTIAEYDEVIKSYADKGDYEITGAYETALLQRTFVNSAGYDVLQSLAGYKKEYRETLAWLMGDTETLRLYLVAGKPEGSYLNSIKVLADLYTTYKADLSDQTISEYGTRRGEVYRTMMLALSLTESGNVYFWMDGKCHSDARTRYQIYKDLYLHAGEKNELIENRIFESLTVEEMRWVMNTVIDDEEIVWLNDYVRNEGKGEISPYNYIQYTFGYDYSLDKYYSQENYAKWDKTYHLSEYGITYKKGEQKLWIVFEEGSVCGGLSKTGSCIWGAYKGLPNTCISQPAHCAYIYYTQNKNGDGVWEVGNNVSGWGQSGKTEHLNIRTMNDWGTGDYTTGWNANYILLAQAAQNEYEKYENAEKILMLAEVYQGNSQKLEEIYRKALAAETLNFDAWLGLVSLYKADAAKTEEAYYRLAQEIAEVLTYYPYPMNDLICMLEPHLTTTEYKTMFTLLQTRTLVAASKATAAESIQDLAVRQVANQLLGNVDTALAAFSFDGEHAGQIILSELYKGTDVAWEYSLDNKKTWIFTEEHTVQLTGEQIASITAENDIHVHIMGVDYSDENIYTIDICESAGLPEKLYANDRENKLIGAADTMEWKYTESDEWITYREEQPDLSGNKTVFVRQGATGTYLASAESKMYSFTEETWFAAESYLPICKLSIHSVSSEQAGNDEAENAIDGNIHTIWHTKHDASDTDRTIVLKVEEPVYVSALEYVPRQTGTNGRARNAEVYVSMDGENWTMAASASGMENNADAKMLKFSETIKAQYVKFVVTDNWGDGRSFASAAMLNLFEDKTKGKAPTAEIEYDITETTRNAVTAKLVRPDTDIIITNNEGKDTYIFTENGTFTFEFEDAYGNKGTAKAAVTWIMTESEEGTEVPKEDEELPEEGTEVPKEDEELPEEGAEIPKEDEEQPEEGTEVPKEDEEQPEEGTEIPKEDEELPEEGTEIPKEDEEQPEEGTEVPKEDEKLPEDDTEKVVYRAEEFQEKLKQQDIVIKNQNIVVTFKQGSSYNDTNTASTYDFSAVLIKEYQKSELNGSVDKNQFVAKVVYAYSGELPAEAEITIFIGKEYAGKTVYYALLKEDGSVDDTSIQKTTVKEDGSICVLQKHCSSYIVMLEKTVQQPQAVLQPQDTYSETIKSPATGENTFSFFGWCAVVSGISKILLWKRKNS